jgi:hypothetical protein
MLQRSRSDHFSRFWRNRLWRTGRTRGAQACRSAWEEASLSGRNCCLAANRALREKTESSIDRIGELIDITRRAVIFTNIYAQNQTELARVFERWSLFGS